jgi:CO dehydrogenase maturation factor
LTTTIAVAGKGGTGKTTISALLIQLLAERGTVLAIDADPSTNLNMALGLESPDTVGDVREEMLTAVRGGQFGVGLDKRAYLESRIAESLVESRGVDLLAMGRPEGPGCYCAANNMLRANIDKIGSSYDYVVIDNEAGLEHLSRQTTRDVDALVLVTDPTLRGLVAAARAQALVGELRTHVGRIGLVVNRVRGDLPPALQSAIEEHGLTLWAVIPEEPTIGALDAGGRPLAELPSDSPIREAVREVATLAGLAV